ncbi:hypothetical protein AB0B30_38315 [Streptomyces narbonensis]|uniref:Uncharacterized protein n=1 Tax=Streptomyces narbonensis TaxID=67333 RepID=A0ABV3CMH1_9ACTN
MAALLVHVALCGPKDTAPAARLQSEDEAAPETSTADNVATL